MHVRIQATRLRYLLAALASVLLILAAAIGYRWTEADGENDLQPVAIDSFAAAFTDLGTMGGQGRGNTRASGISADGSVIVGTIDVGVLNWRAFRWTKEGGVQDLGSLGGSSLTLANGISPDGKVIVGTSGGSATSGPHVFRWTKETGMEDLGTMGGTGARGGGISANGAIVGDVDYDTGPGTHSHVFRWTKESGVQDLGTMGGEAASAYAVSADGTVIVGVFSDSSYGQHAFRWTEAEGARDLGNLGHVRALANGVSADGSVVYGKAMGFPIWRAFSWTQTGGMQDLGTFGGVGAELDGVSADGSLLLGTVEYENDKHIFLYSTTAAIAARQRQDTADRERSRKIAKSGNAAQIYVLADDMAAKGKPDLVGTLRRALIERFPESTYTTMIIKQHEGSNGSGGK